MSLGGGVSSQASTPLNAQQRSDIYQGGVSDIAGTQAAGTLNTPSYVAPTYQQGMTTGDYTSMTDQLTKAGEAGLDYQLANAQKAENNDAAKRGIWSSGLVAQQDKDLQASFAPQYAAAGATAAGQAANLSQTNATAQNAFNQSNAQQQFQSGWAPLNYLQGIYNQTGGAISSGGSGSGSISI